MLLVVLIRVIEIVTETETEIVIVIEIEIDVVVVLVAVIDRVPEAGRILNLISIYSELSHNSTIKLNFFKVRKDLSTQTEKPTTSESVKHDNLYNNKKTFIKKN